MCQRSKENIHFPRSCGQKKSEKNIRVIGFLGHKKIRKIWGLTIKGPEIQMKIVKN